MFSERTRGVLLILLLVALLLRQGLVILLFGLMGLAIGAALLWGRWALRRLSYERTVSAPRAFVGDEVTLTQRVVNAKLLWIPSLRIDETIPADLDLIDQRLLAHPKRNLATLRRWATLRPYEALIWTARVRCPRRGYFRFGPTHLEATDTFGIHTRTLDDDRWTSLVVYPELIAVPDLGLRARHPIGEARAPRQLLTDPSRTIGIRDYRRDDPFKAIHWGATARRGELQTRIFEPTTSLQVVILLNIDTFEYYWEGMRYDLVEPMISAAATVATQAAESRLSVGLYSNGTLGDGGNMVRVVPGRSPSQLALILESLAKMTAYSALAFPAMLQRIGATIDHGTTIVLISAVASESITTALLQLSRGRRIVWLYTGDESTPSVPGVEVVPLSLAAARWARSDQPIGARPS